MVKWYKKKKRKKAKAKATKHFRKMQKGYEASVLKCLKKYFFQSFLSCETAPGRVSDKPNQPFAGTNWNVSVGVGRGHPILLT